jgi:hypothetical protein
MGLSEFSGNSGSKIFLAKALISLLLPKQVSVTGKILEIKL